MQKALLVLLAVISFFLLVACSKPEQSVENITAYMEKIDSVQGSKEIKGIMRQCIGESIAGDDILKKQDCVDIIAVSRKVCLSLKQEAKKTPQLSRVSFDLGTKQVMPSELDCSNKADTLMLSIMILGDGPKMLKHGKFIDIKYGNV